jgi:hypothetical protein
VKPTIAVAAAVVIAFLAIALLRRGSDEDHLFDVGDRIVYRATQRVAARCGGSPGDRRAATIGGLPGDVRRLASGRKVAIPPGSYWIVDAGSSCDSRVVGPIPFAQVEPGD